MKQSLLDFLQSASNMVAGNVAGPVDLLGMGLNKIGVPVGNAPVGGSEWLKRKGLMRDVQQGPARVLGETAGLLGPAMVTQFAPQIAKGLLQGADNLAAPATLNKQAGVVGVDYVRAQGNKPALPTDDIFSQAVANTPGAQLADDGLLIRLQRNQQPAQEMAPSVRGGVFYLPEGAAQAKHYSTGNSGYGGKQKITGETLIQNPMFVKGATGGKAPEAALDALKGKGAYEAMRSEALNVYGFNRSPAMKAEMVEAFLNKHAPDLSGYSEYIVKSSPQGNQLAYALQEAAVGQAVRDAGKDAVLGYSKGKAGPFISEVFDVRESHYPGLNGLFETWR